MNEVLWDCLGIIGVGCIMGGIACWSWPLAFVFVGIVLLLLGIFGARTVGARRLR